MTTSKLDEMYRVYVQIEEIADDLNIREHAERRVFGDHRVALMKAQEALKTALGHVGSIIASLERGEEE